MPSKLTPYRRAYTRMKQAEVRVRNRAFVHEINARTVCAHCGAQPIEWHNPEHVELGRQGYRISALIGRAAIATIQAEMARCTPLCRRCHMVEDGRLVVFLTRPDVTGSKNPRAKITEADVPTIRQRLANGETVTALASELGVTIGAISHIKNGLSWKHVP